MKKKTMAVIHPKDSEAPAEGSSDQPTKEVYLHRECLSDSIAQGRLTVRNWRIPGAFELFPNAPSFRMVDKFYQHAQPKPLAVDECSNAEMAKKFMEHKRPLCEKAGVRYLAVYPNMSRHDAEEQMRTQL